MVSSWFHPDKRAWDDTPCLMTDEGLSTGEASIVVDCLGHKLRGFVKVHSFQNPPQFAVERVQVESADDLLPLISGTKELYMTGTQIVGDEEVVSKERRLVAEWLQGKLQPQFEFPIEVTSESASHHGKVLARFAGAEEPSKSWQRFYSTFHIDHKQNSASIEEGVQVNVWLNLTDLPISDFNLGFLERGGKIISGEHLPKLNQEDMEEVMIRYQKELTKKQAGLLSRDFWPLAKIWVHVFPSVFSLLWYKNREKYTDLTYVYHIY